MQNSGISSLAGISPSQSPAGPARKRFALKGRSIAIDPKVDAVRRDLADIRLADRVFAPHYAAPMARIIASAVSLHAGPKPDSDVLIELASGEPFEVLELAGDHAWGVAPARKLVGYVPASVLQRPGA